MENNNTKLGDLDYSACMRCALYNPEKDKCGWEIYSSLGNLSEEWKCMSESYQVLILGCENFSWNGFPLNEKALEEILNSEVFRTSILKTIANEQPTKKTFDDITRVYGCGKNFKRAFFDWDNK